MENNIDANRRYQYYETLDRKNLGFKFITPSTRFIIEYLGCRQLGAKFQVSELAKQLNLG